LGKDNKNDLMLVPFEDGSSSKCIIANETTSIIDNVMMRREWELRKEQLHKFRSSAASYHPPPEYNYPNSGVNQNNNHRRNYKKRENLSRNYRVRGLGSSILHPSHTISSTIEGYAPISWSRCDKANATEFYFRVDDDRHSNMIRRNMRVAGVMPHEAAPDDPVTEIIKRYVTRAEDRSGPLPGGVSSVTTRLQHCGNGKVEIERNKDIEIERNKNVQEEIWNDLEE